MTDLTYLDNGFYITLIPNSREGEYIYNTIANEFNGVGVFPSHMKASIFKQIKDAGYKIRKAKKPKKIDWTDEDQKLLEVLGA
ncbi:MAG: hypothetical protein CBC71_06235 [Rhodobacteraceae bacterium TMED111]|nr:hypothetical protein [Marinovum sp.]OUV41097.1 MAG: hypothetical protein CBC71_06235 [Rhodobacteraceae bacterium TMED111]|tara:strand:- start:19354 stop:19602 length:249 start_codon:yes stop_codon:yes gene_type:complete